MTVSGTSRFLVKFREPTARGALRISARLGMAATAVSFACEPLFQSIGVTRGRGVAAGGGVWRLATASAKLEDGNAWDHCHDILAQNDGVMLVEPDFEQAVDLRRARRCRPQFQECGLELQPQDIGDGYAGDETTIIGSAIASTANSTRRQRRPVHQVRASASRISTQATNPSTIGPQDLRADLARNFVDADVPTDATDRSTGVLNNFSHGCGTLSILAALPFRG